MAEDDVSREYLLEAKKGIKRITKFVRSLLDFSWGLSSVGREMDINQTITECLVQFEHECKPSQIEINKNFSSKLPKIADYGLKIVFNNIIKNAVEAMNDEGKLSVSTKLEGDFIELSFLDTGPGIPAQVCEKIFDPFFTTKSMGEGSGLGLAISREIVERYQGRISVESEKDKGTNFKIVLPLNEQSLRINIKQ